MQDQTSKALIPLQPQQHSVSARRNSLIREWVLRFQVNTGQNFTPEHASALVSLWTDSFADVKDGALEAAFLKTISSCKFWPKIADIREHLDHGKDAYAQEKAAQDWQMVRDYIRLDYHPDLSVKRGPKFSERTRRAINAAGGLAYLAEGDTRATGPIRRHKPS